MIEAFALFGFILLTIGICLTSALIFVKRDPAPAIILIVAGTVFLLVAQKLREGGL